MVSSDTASTFAFYAPFVVGPISFFSSVLLVVLLLLHPQHRKHLRERPKEQFLLGLSILEMCGSFANSWSTLPTPSFDRPYGHEPSDIFKKWGTVATCDVQGFLQQLGFCAPLYNACLCIYYLLTVVGEVPSHKLMKCWVPVCHICIAVYALATATTALVLKLYNYAGMLGCWIHRANGIWYTCENEGLHCDRYFGDTFRFEVGFLGVHISVSALITIVSMIVLTVKVLRTEQRSYRGTARNYTATAGSGRWRGKQEARLPLTRRTMETGILYSVSLLLVYFPLFVTTLLPWGTPRQIVRMSTAVLTPSQGFWNLLIFTSPHWLKWIHEHSCCFCLRMATFGVCRVCCCPDDGSTTVARSDKTSSDSKPNQDLKLREDSIHQVVEALSNSIDIKLRDRSSLRMSTKSDKRKSRVRILEAAREAPAEEPVANERERDVEKEDLFETSILPYRDEDDVFEAQQDEASKTEIGLSKSTYVYSHGDAAEKHTSETMDMDYDACPVLDTEEETKEVILVNDMESGDLLG